MLAPVTLDQLFAHVPVGADESRAPGTPWRRPPTRSTATARVALGESPTDDFAGTVSREPAGEAAAVDHLDDLLLAAES